MVISLPRRLLAAWSQRLGIATAANPKARRAGSSQADACGFAFCLALHRTGVTSAAASPRRWCALTLRPRGPHHFTVTVVGGQWPMVRMSFVSLTTGYWPPTTAVSFLWPCPVSPNFFDERSPLATVLPCGVRTFLPNPCDRSRRPSGPLSTANYSTRRPMAIEHKAIEYKLHQFMTDNPA